jgi:GNAT superfamily N-acetyltransferase
MSVDPVIRSATPADLEIVRGLDANFRSALAGQRGGEAWLAEHWSLSDVDDSVLTAHTLVGVIDGHVVGHAVWSVVEDSTRGPIILVDRIHVAVEARELGFGDALLAGVIEIGVARGCRFVEGSALPGDRDTKNMYERAGVTARNIVVSRRLDA